MGWASGSGLFCELWDTVKKHIPKKNRKKIIQAWIEIFENQDCDTIDEVCDEFPEIAKVYRETYPERFEDEDVEEYEE